MRPYFIDITLSLAAQGLLNYLIQHHLKCKFCIYDLVEFPSTNCPAICSDSYEKVEKTIQELVDATYLIAVNSDEWVLKLP